MMKKNNQVLIRIFAAMIFAGFINTIFAGDKMSVNELQKNIEEKLDALDGTFAVAFLDIQNKENIILINSEEEFHAASTMKTPVMMELFKQAVEGKFSLADSILVLNEFKSIVDGTPYSMEIDRDGGEDLYGFLGKKRAMLQLIHSMITVSSNLATNILIEIADAKKVTATMRSIGAETIKVLRGVEDTKAYEAGLNNTTTAYDLMKIFEVIAANEFVSERVCREMTEILLDQKFNSIIPALLPAEVRVAHKTGSISYIQHDSGFVILPDERKYVLVLLSKHFADREKVIETFAQISKDIYDFMTDGEK